MRSLFLFLVLVVATSFSPALACEPDSEPSRELGKRLKKLEIVEADIGLLKGLLEEADSCSDAYVLNTTLSLIHAVTDDVIAAATYQEAAFGTGWGNEQQRSERLETAANLYLSGQQFERGIQLYTQVLERGVDLTPQISSRLMQANIGANNYIKAAYWADRFFETGGSVQTDKERRLFAYAYLQTNQPEKAALYEKVEEAPDDSAVVENIHVTYPKRALERGIEGMCELTFSVDRSGKAFDIEPICSNNIFLESAEEAIARARFEVSTVDGIPQETHGTRFPIRFRLSE